MGFRNDLVKSIQKGQKTETWRRGDKTSEYAENDIVDLINSDDKTTDTHALANGFANKDAFMASIMSLYPDITLDETMTIIGFSVII